MRIEELGQRVKAKYPQYKDLSDLEVGQNVLQKYPQYRAQITPTLPEIPTGEIERKGIMGRIAGIGEYFAPLLGTLTRATQLPYFKKLEEEPLERYKKMGEQVLRQIRNPDIPREQKLKLMQSYRQSLPRIIESHPDIQKTTQQILGEAAITALTVVAPKVPTKIPRLGPLATRAVTMPPTTAAWFGAEAMRKGRPLEEIPREMAKGAVTGLIAAPVSWYAQKGLEKVGRGLYRSLVRYSQAPDKSARHLIANKIRGTISTIDKALRTDVKAYEAQVKNLLRGSKARVTEKQIIQEAFRLKQKRDPTLVRFLSPDDFSDDMQKALDSIDFKIDMKRPNMLELNEMRKKIGYKVSNPNYFRMFDENPKRAQDLRFLQEAMSNIVKENVPATVPVFREYSPVVNAAKAISYTKYRIGRYMPITFFELGGLFYPPTMPYMLKIAVARRLMTSGMLPSYGGAGALWLAELIERGATRPEIQAMLQRTLADILVSPE